MEDAFDPLYGEAWSETQLSALLLGPGNWMLVLEVEERFCGFAVARSVLDEAELMLIAVPQKMRGRGYGRALLDKVIRSEEHTSELQSLMRINNAVFCLK